MVVGVEVGPVVGPYEIEQLCVLGQVNIINQWNGEENVIGCFKRRGIDDSQLNQEYKQNYINLF